MGECSSSEQWTNASQAHQHLLSGEKEILQSCTGPSQKYPQSEEAQLFS